MDYKERFIGFFAAAFMIMLIGVAYGATVISDTLINTTANFTVAYVIGSFIPYTDDAIDLGNSSHQWRNANIDGTLEADTITQNGLSLWTYAGGIDYANLTLADGSVPAVKVSGTAWTYTGGIPLSNTTGIWGTTGGIPLSNTTGIWGTTGGIPQSNTTGIWGYTGGVNYANMTFAAGDIPAATVAGTAWTYTGGIPLATNVSGTLADASLEAQIDRTGFTASSFFQGALLNSSGTIVLQPSGDTSDGMNFSISSNDVYFTPFGSTSGMYIQNHNSAAGRISINAKDRINITSGTEDIYFDSGSGQIYADDPIVQTQSAGCLQLENESGTAYTIKVVGSTLTTAAGSC